MHGDKPVSLRSDNGFVRPRGAGAGAHRVPAGAQAPMPYGAKHSQDRPGSSPTAPMSREAAEAVLRRHGLDAAGLAPEELKRRWQDLARRHHPDLGGDL